MKIKRFEENEIPFRTLEQFGLTREMIEDLPLAVLEDISLGRRSPVLPIRVTDENGNVFKNHSRFSLVRMENGQVDIMFYPVLQQSPIEKYNDEQRKQLLDGKAIVADMELPDGKHTKTFVQIDTETKQVTFTPTPVIVRNLQVLSQEMKLSNAEIRMMQQGEPLTFVMDNETVTVGIDLNSKTGIRFCEGDGQKWQQQAKREWDKYTFGCYGCWVIGDDGYPDYVAEENYTEELWNEQKKSAHRNASSLHK